MAASINLLSCVVGVICLIADVYAQDLLGCGGFVKSLAPIDFSRVEVKFLSKATNSVKYKTTCAPNNGYYLVPLYDKGEYVVRLEAPEGWSFDKAEVNVNVNGVDDPCTLQEDINFEFVGFSVTGRIVSKGTTTGPAGVKLELVNSNTEATLSGESGPGGMYTFEKLMPGSYELTPSHPSWDIEKGPFFFDLVDGALNLARNIQVYGYDVNGRVSDGESPVEGVRFFLTRSDGRNFYCVESESARKPHDQVTLRQLCSTESVSSGKFHFPSVAVGEYILRAQFTKGELKFELKPSELEMSVTQGSVLIKEPFQLEGFEVKGTVRSSQKGGGVGKAQVFVNGDLRAQSDDRGQYTLSNMSAGKCTIKIEAEDLEFESIEHTITLASPNVPDVFPSKYAVCGGVQVDPQFEGQSWTVEVSDSQAVVSSKNVDATGGFCFMLKAGMYSIKIVVSESDLSNGLVFKPSSHDVTVKDRPLKDIKFSQFKTSISGEVTCIGQCTKSISISLNRLNQETLLKPDKIEVDGKILTFKFSSVYPGSYAVSVSVPNWCWSESRINIEVKPVTSGPIVQFAQTGYVLNATASHPAVLEYKHSQISSFKGKLELESGHNSFCLNKEGSYSLRVSEGSCHRFQEESFVYNVNSPEPISLSATHHKILFAAEIPGEVASSEVTLRIRSQFYSEIEPDLLLNADSVTNGTSEEAVKILHFVHRARTSDRLEIVPLSNLLLFSPQKTFYDVSNSCPQNGAQFFGSRGMIVEGEVSPPLVGVTIKIRTEGYNPVVVETNEKGQYTAGPFMAGAKLDIEASMDGYSFSRHENDTYSFIASALSSVTVKITDENGKPLQGALVSLSGVNFRSNSLTSSSGDLNFTELTSGQYHIRPFYREYNFDPPSKDITVEEGSNLDVSFIGHRTAFSCIGSVKTLVGEGVPGAVVKLTTVPREECMDLSESVETEETGSFRISGLVPSCEYALAAHFDKKQSLQAVPPEIKILGSKNDITDVVFIAMPTVNKMEVSGYVSTKPEFITALKVSLYEGASSSHPLHAVGLDSSGFFYLPPVAYKEDQTYTVSLESHLSRNKYEYNLTSVDFKSIRGMKHINMEFEAKDIVVTKKASYILQLLVSILFASAFLLFGLSKVFGLTHLDVINRFSQFSTNHDDKMKKKHK
jgi:hypothetical protein